MKNVLFKSLLAIACLLSSISVSAYDIAVENADGVTIYYYFNNNNTELNVTYCVDKYGYRQPYTGSIVIPESVTYQGNTYKVTRINGTAFRGDWITSITIPSSMKRIGENAFKDCDKLKKVIVEDLTAWCNISFENGISNPLYQAKHLYSEADTEITDLTIPNDVTSIGDKAFYGCSGFKSVTIPNSVINIGNDAFYGCSGLKKVIAEDLTAWCNISFGNENSNPLYYANHLYIGADTEIRDLAIPDDVTSIRAYAFEGCKGLTSVTISNSVTSIGSNAFEDCNGLKKVITKNLAAWCNISFGNGNSNPLYYANHLYSDANTEITDLAIPDDATSIGNYAFYGCSSFKSVAIPNSVISIGNSTFRECSGLTSITIPEAVTSIGNYTFSGCPLESLTFNAINCSDFSSYSAFPSTISSVVFGNNVIKIPKHIFSGGSHIESLTIPNSVTSIDDYTFYYCYNLKSVTIGSGVLSISNNAFVPLTKVIWLTNTPPSGYTNVNGKVNYVSNEQYTSLSNKTVYPFLSSMFEVDGIKYVPVSPSERTCDAIDCVYNESAKNVHIANTVTNQGISLTVKRIHPYALHSNEYVKNVELSHGGDIGDYAFYGCTALESTKLSNGGGIGEYAFYGCTALESVELSNSGDIDNNAFAFSNIASTLNVNNAGNIEKSAFANTTGSYMAKINCMGELESSAFKNSTGLTTLEIGDKVTQIGDDAFNGCSSLESTQIYHQGRIGANAFRNCTSMETATLGDQITSLGNNAFRGCSKLQSIVIPNTVQTIGNYAFYGCESLTSAKIGTGIQSIETYTFSGCTSLTDMQIGSNVSTIDTYAFSGCFALAKITIPQSVTKIANYVFKGCSSLASVTFEDAEVQEENPTAVQFPDWTSTNHGNNSESHQEYTFSVVPGDYLQFNYAVDSESGYDKLIVKINGSKVLEESGNKTGNYRRDFTETGDVTLYLSYMKDRANSSGKDEASVTDIWLNGGSGYLTLGSNGSSPLFSDCPLDSVYIGRNISYDTSSSYGYSPFYRNTSLRAVTITDAETEIPVNEFYGCTSLKNVKIGNSVTTIGDWAFSGCSSLDNFEFGSAVETIGKEAFSDCTAMTKLISHAVTPPTCDSQALDDINKWACTLSVPTGYTAAYQQADQWKDFFFINDDAETAGIENIINDNAENVVVYTLGGVKRIMRKADVKSLPHGIYVINGKKVIVK